MKCLEEEIIVFKSFRGASWWVGSALPAFSTCICVFFLETSTQGSEQVLGVEEHFLPHLVSPNSHQRGNREQSLHSPPVLLFPLRGPWLKVQAFALFAGAGPLIGSLGPQTLLDCFAVERRKKKKKPIFITQRGEPYTRHLWVGSGWVGEWRTPKEGSLICGSRGPTKIRLRIESHLNLRSWRLTRLWRREISGVAVREGAWWRWTCGTSRD